MSKGLRGIGLRNIIPDQIDFKQAISGSLVLTNITTPTNIESGLGHIYFKSDGKLYFKSSFYQETDLTEGSSGLNFFFKTALLSVESDPDYGYPTNSGDWPDNFSDGESVSVDATLSGGGAIVTTGHDYSQTGDPAAGIYYIDATNAVATTNNGNTLTTLVSGHDDVTPTEFTLSFLNSESDVVISFLVTVAGGDTKLTLNNLNQYEINTDALSNVSVTIPFKVNATGASVTTMTRSFTVQKIKIGQEGATSKTIVLTSNKFAFTYDERGNIPTGAQAETATLTATAQDSSDIAQIYYEFYDITADQQLQNGTSPTYTFTQPNSSSSLPKVIEVRMRSVASNADEDTIISRDQITLIGVVPGSGAYQATMGNSSHTVSAERDENGNPTDLTMAGSGPGHISVYRGASRLTLVTSGDPGDGEFSVTDVSSPNSVVTGIDTTPSLDTTGLSPGGQNKDAIFSDHTGMSSTVNVGLVVYTINCEDQETISIIQTVTKSIEGAKGDDGPGGSNARAVEIRVTSGKSAIEFDQNGDNDSSITIASVELTADVRNSTGTLTYSWTIDDVAEDPSANGYTGNHSINSDGSVFTYSTTGKDYDDFPEKIEVEVTESGISGVVARDQINLISLKPGSDAVKVDMPNNNTSVVSEELVITNGVAGTVDYSTTGDTIRVYRGNVQLTPIASSVTDPTGTGTPTTGQFSVTSRAVSAGTITTGDLTINTDDSDDPHIVVGQMSNMTTDSALITYTFNAEDKVTVSSVTTVAKSKAGATGGTGADGISPPGVDLEIDPAVVVYSTAGTNPDVSAIDLTATTRNLGSAINVLDFSGGYTNSSNASHAYIADSNTSGLLDFGDSSSDVGFSIAFWAHLDGGGSSNTRYLFGKYASSQGYYCLYGDSNTSTSTERGRFSITLRGNSQSNSFLAPTVSGKRIFEDSFDKWVHICMVYTPETSANANNEKIQFYKNGKPWGSAVTTSNASYVAMPNTTTQFNLGTLGTTNGAGNRLQGLLSNFLIYRHDGTSPRGNTPLTDSDVESLYNSGMVHTNYKDSGMPKYQDLVCYWKLNESISSNTLLEDSSGNDLDLTTAGGNHIARNSNSGLRQKSGPSYFTFTVAGSTVGTANQTFPYAQWQSVPSTFANFKGDPKTVVVQLRAENASDPQDARDQGSITAINPGSNAPTIIVHNPKHDFNGSDQGVVSSYAGSGTQIQVYSNGVLLEPITSGTPSTDSGTFKIVGSSVSPADRLDVSTTYTLSDDDGNGTNDMITVGDHDVGDDPFTKTDDKQNAVITYTLNIEGVEIPCTQNFTVNRPGEEGVGVDGATVNSDGVLEITLSDGSTLEAGTVVGDNGEDGVSPPGVDLEFEPSSVAYDASGANPNVSSIDITATTRNLGSEIVRSAFFNHASAYARRSTSGGLGVAQGNYLTVGFWIRFPSTETFTSNTWRYICYSDELQIYVYQDDLVFKHKRAGSSSLFTVTLAEWFNTSDAGKWVHVVLARHSNGVLYHYKNGALKGSNNHGGGATQILALDSTFYLGNDSGSNQIGAELSNFVIWNNYGAATLALQQYNSGKVLTSPIANGVSYAGDVQVWYKLDENQGTTGNSYTQFNDSSGNAKHLNSGTQYIESISNPGLFSKTGPSYFTFKVAGTVIGDADQEYPYVSWSDIPATYVDFTTTPQTVTVEVKADGSNDSVDARDQGSILALKEGDGAYTIELTNPVHNINADNDGVPSSFLGSGTTIKVFKGTTQLNTTSGTPSAGSATWKVASYGRSSTKIGVGAATRNANNYVYANLTDWAKYNAPSETAELSGYIDFNLNIEGNTITKRQSFALNQAGATGADSTVPGDDGADVGITIEVRRPLALVQTDSFGNALSTGYDNTYTRIYVKKQGVYQEAVSSNPQDGQFTVQIENNLTSGTFTNGTIALGASSETLVDSTARKYYWFANNISAMTDDAVARGYRITVNVDGTLYYPTTIQTIMKAVAQVDEIQCVIEKPVVTLPRDNYSSTYQPTISDYSAAETYIRVYKNGVAVPYHNTVDASMSNNRFRVDVGQSDDFPTINIQPGNVSYASTYIANVGSPSGYDNSAFPNPAVIDYQVRYKDTVGNFHNFPVRQTMNPVDVPPSLKTFGFGIYHDFQDYPLIENSNGIDTSDAGDLARYSTLKTGFESEGSGRYFYASILPQFKFTWGLNGKSPESPGFFAELPADGKWLEVTGYQTTAGTNVEGYIATNERTSRYTNFTATSHGTYPCDREVVAFPGRNIRLVGARGQLYYTQLQWSEYRYAADGNSRNSGYTHPTWRDCYFGVDLYLRDGACSDELVYLCTINFQNGDPFANIGGTVDVYGSDASTRHAHPITGVTDRSSDASTAHDSTHIMKVADDEKIVPVMWFQRGTSWGDRIPDYGFIWVNCYIEYYEI